MGDTQRSARLLGMGRQRRRGRFTQHGDSSLALFDPKTFQQIGPTSTLTPSSRGSAPIRLWIMSWVSSIWAGCATPRARVRSERISVFLRSRSATLVA